MHCGCVYRPLGARSCYGDRCLYGLGGVIVPFVGIKLIDLILQALQLV
ncbi:MAG: hypothetical protein U0745_07350 [Polyangia bacterium]